MSALAQESYESVSNMLNESLSAGSSVTESPSPGFSGYSQEEYSESVQSDRVVDLDIYTANGYQQVSFQN